MNYDTIEVGGREVGLGPMPMCLREIGFKSRAEVRAVAAKYSTREPYMNLDDVAAYLGRAAR